MMNERGFTHGRDEMLKANHGLVWLLKWDGFYKDLNKSFTINA